MSRCVFAGIAYIDDGDIELLDRLAQRDDVHLLKVLKRLSCLCPLADDIDRQIACDSF